MNEENGKNIPLITVVIAAYNSRAFIEKCLQAIHKQTYPHIEIIVVDGKTYNPDEQKKCREIIEKYATYLQDGPERSIQRNRGIREAHGQYLLVIDQDMYIQPDVIQECYDLLTTQNLTAVIVPEISIGEGFWTKCVALDRYITIYLEKGANECARFFQKEVGLAVGGFNPDIVGAEDSDFHYKLAEKGPIGKIKAHANHDEGRTRFWTRVKKKYYYSQAFRKYMKQKPVTATRAYFPLKTAYLKHIGLLVRHPVLATGIILLRSAEITAGILGLLIKK